MSNQTNFLKFHCCILILPNVEFFAYQSMKTHSFLILTNHRFLTRHLLLTLGKLMFQILILSFQLLVCLCCLFRSVWLISLHRNAPQFCQNVLKKAPQQYLNFFLPPQQFLLHFYASIFFRCQNFLFKKLSLPVNNFWILFLLHIGLPSTLKNAPLWNYLRHRCLKCAHISTIALTIIHTGSNVRTSSVVLGYKN